MTDESRAFTVKFLNKKQLAADTYSFYFERPTDFNFAPGQYLRMILEIVNPDERGISRFFTICSSPTEKDHLMITTRIIQSSFKTTLASLSERDDIKIFGPQGNFIFDEKEKNPHVFLAGGIGITPYRSMIKYAVDKNINVPITLFTSFKTVAERVFQDEFAGVKRNHHWFKHFPTITHPENPKSWQGHTGRINEDWIKQNLSDLYSSLFYISGPETMVDALSEVVKSLEVNEDRLRTEKFPGY